MDLIDRFVEIFRKLFQARSFYYATHFNPDLPDNKRYFTKPYDITLCAQRMVQGHDSDIRFYWFVLIERKTIELKRIFSQESWFMFAVAQIQC